MSIEIVNKLVQKIAALLDVKNYMMTLGKLIPVVRRYISVYKDEWYLNEIKINETRVCEQVLKPKS